MINKSDLETTLDKYCNLQIDKLRSYPQFEELMKIVNETGNTIKLNFGKGLEPFSNNFYISLEILNSNSHLIETVNGNLTSSSCIIVVDKHKRIKFFDWTNDEEFKDDIDWILSELK